MHCKINIASKEEKERKERKKKKTEALIIS